MPAMDSRRMAPAATAAGFGALAAAAAKVASTSQPGAFVPGVLSAARTKNAPRPAWGQGTSAAAASAPASTGLGAAAPSALALAGAAALALGGGRRAGQKRRAPLKAYTTAPQTYEGAPIGPPPDMPSLLLKNRIVYLGTPITNQVTELIVAQLLYLNYESSDKPVTMYINSTGSSMKNSTRFIGERKVGRETDAFAIADCMKYIKPQVSTVTIGSAYGTAAMLLAMGTKGKRFALPNAGIMLSEPREPPAQGPRQASDIKILAEEVLQNRSTINELLAVATGKTTEQLAKDTGRCYYMTPDEAVDYGVIDKVLTTDKLEKEVGQMPSFAKAL